MGFLCYRCLARTVDSLCHTSESMPPAIKKFMKGGQMSGGYFSIPGNDGPQILVEGITTGLSVNMATGNPVIVAFFANNLTAVARMARDRYPNREIIIAADNDVATFAKHGKKPWSRCRDHCRTGDWRESGYSRSGRRLERHPCIPWSRSSSGWDRGSPST